MSASDLGSLLAGGLLVAGSLLFLLTAVGMLRAGDAVSRVNNLSPATGAGLPLIILGVALHELSQGDLGVVDAVEAALAIAASLVVSSVASNMLGRSAYRTQHELDPRTLGDALGPARDLPDPTAEVSRRDDQGTGAAD